MPPGRRRCEGDSSSLRMSRGWGSSPTRRIGVWGTHRMTANSRSLPDPFHALLGMTAKGNWRYEKAGGRREGGAARSRCFHDPSAHKCGARRGPRFPHWAKCCVAPDGAFSRDAGLPSASALG